MNKTVVKRDGKVISFNEEKIIHAVEKAFLATEQQYDQAGIIEKIVKKIEHEDKKVWKVEELQDLIEKKLLKLAPEVGKNFLIYRRERTKVRNKKHNDMIKEIVSLGKTDLVKENANMALETPSGMTSKAGFETLKMYAQENLLKEEHFVAHTTCDIHAHDLDWYPTKAVNCLQTPAESILRDGFKEGNGGMAGCKRISTAATMMAISLQTSQNLFFGGQSIGAFDYDLAPYIEMTFNEIYKETLENLNLKDEVFEPIEYNYEKLTEELKGYERARAIAINKTIRETQQAMQGFVHNMNAMHSRGKHNCPVV